MRPAAIKFLLIAILMAGLVLAIANTDSRSSWLGIWMILILFVGLPLSLLAIRDLLVAASSRKSESFGSWALLHICAIFAAIIGWLVGYMAVESQHPKAELHRWLVLALPGFVYLSPVLMALHGDIGFMSKLAKPFRRRKRHNDEA